MHATVVRAQSPTSARPGDDAIVTRDGTIEGFVGGQCVKESVRTAALAALEDGEPVLLRVLPDATVSFPETPGARLTINPCLSGGALEIFLEPHLPSAVVEVVGDTPVADAVAMFAEGVGFAVGRSLPGQPPEGAIAVIVSSHGDDEPESIRAALDAGVGYIGLVASRTRGEAVLEAMDLSDGRTGSNPHAGRPRHRRQDGGRDRTLDRRRHRPGEARRRRTRGAARRDHLAAEDRRRPGVRYVGDRAGRYSPLVDQRGRDLVLQLRLSRPLRGPGRLGRSRVRHRPRVGGRFFAPAWSPETDASLPRHDTARRDSARCTKVRPRSGHGDARRSQRRGPSRRRPQ